MSDKYIIRNCPAFVLMRTATSGTYFDMCGNAKGHIKCQDCIDCVMKQIVELCKEPKVINCNIDGKEQVLKAYHHTPLGGKILELLDIQECDK